MATAEMSLEVKDVLSVLIYVMQDKDRFHVHTVQDGEMVDVTDQYEVLAVTVPGEDGKPARRGFTVIKKEDG